MVPTIHPPTHRPTDPPTDQPEEDPLGLNRIETVIGAREDGEPSAPLIETAPSSTAVLLVKSYLHEQKCKDEIETLIGGWVD